MKDAIVSVTEENTTVLITEGDTPTSPITVIYSTDGGQTAARFTASVEAMRHIMNAFTSYENKMKLRKLGKKQQ